MAEPFATTADLTARWRALTLPETDTATTLLSDASSKMRNYCRDNGRNLDLALANDELDFDTAKRIACGMVKRAMSAPVGIPESVGQAQQSAGPFSVGFTFTNPDGNLYLTKGEKQELLTGLKGKAFTLDTAPTGPAHAETCTLLMGGTYCSCGANLTNYEYPLYGG